MWLNPALNSQNKSIDHNADSIVTHIQSHGTVVIKAEHDPTVTPTSLLTKVRPHGTKVRLITITPKVAPIPEPESEPEYESGDSYDEDSDDYDNQVSLETLNDKIISLDAKLDQIIAKLGHHDAAFKIIKYNMKDLRNKMENNVHQLVTCSSQKSPSPPPNKRHKRSIIFPILDDDYLLRLEELVQTDEDTRDELTDLFLEGPSDSKYEFIRRNTLALFEHTSKYTWTGREGNPKDKAGCARRLQLVEILLSSGCEKFPCSTRDDMERIFQRALKNFNGTKYIKWPKRRLQREVALEEQTANGDAS